MKTVFESEPASHN